MPPILGTALDILKDAICNQQALADLEQLEATLTGVFKDRLKARHVFSLAGHNWRLAQANASSSNGLPA